MVFNSLEFAWFLPLVLLIYYRLPHRQQNLFLLLASWFFYGWWDARFLLLLAATILLDFTCAWGMQRFPRGRRAFLLTSVVVNLTILAVFKYFNFFLDSFAATMDGLGLPLATPAWKLILPVGISFYTFQSLAYSIDVYRGRLKPCRNLVDFALYVSFFPQLVAGPIERAEHLLPQIQQPRRITWQAWDEGAWLILWGLFKKVAVADVLAPHVDLRFAHPELCGSGELWSGMYLFALQIYCDFSGYSNIARGVSRWLGFELMVNFNQPYFAASITEFWRRWHISLSLWLRDYLYIPLGGNRRGAARTLLNLLITMLLGGLWHGAAWHYVVWGGLQGSLLAGERLLEIGRAATGPTPNHLASCSRILTRIASVCVTFHLTCLAWVVFRAESLAAAGQYLSGLAGRAAPPLTSPHTLRVTSVVALLVIIDALQASRGEYFLLRWPWPVRGLALGMVLILLTVLGNWYAEVPFIYFQF